jgi:hypothetical protein
VAEDVDEAVTPSSSSIAIKSEEAVESVQGLENEEIDPTLGTKNFPPLHIKYVWNIERK